VILISPLRTSRCLEFQHVEPWSVLNSGHTDRLYNFCGSQEELGIFPFTASTDWFTWPRRQSSLRGSSWIFQYNSVSIYFTKVGTGAKHLLHDIVCFRIFKYFPFVFYLLYISHSFVYSISHIPLITTYITFLCLLYISHFFVYVISHIPLFTV
jgi:hypothetical protein